MNQAKASVLAAVTLALALVLCVARVLAAPQRPGSQEEALFQAANRERVAQGLKPLHWSAPLAQAAHAHATLMAQRNTLSHQLPGEPDLPQRVSRAGARFSTIAENVAEGPSPEDIHAQWMKSPPHRENLLDPDLDSVGIAVAMRGATLFAAEDFSHGIDDLSLSEQEQLLSAQLRTQGLRILGETADARRTCLMDNGYAGTPTPDFVVHYLTSDVAQLPDLLQTRVQSGRYHSAAVGACAPNAKDPGSQYRVAVLLFE